MNAESNKLTIRHTRGEYDILIGAGLLNDFVTQTAGIVGKGPVGILCNATVNELYAESLRQTFKQAGIVTRTILIPDGEEYKTLATAEQVITALIQQGIDRSSTIVTIGGGVTTDLGGFVASVLYRGIKLIHIPTTLLAMVDASVGGKTGVNHKSGKNLIGTFFQPDRVLMDTDTLESLTVRDRVAGFGEMLKMGAILDREYFEFLSMNMNDIIHPRNQRSVTRAILRSCELKAQVVENDEKEAGLRRILNFGHTLGHAIENTLGYGRIRHGEAVIAGMYGAGWLSNQVGNLSNSEWGELAQVLKSIPLELAIDDLDSQGIEKATRLDKKVSEGALHFILLENIGSAVVKSGIPTLMIKLAVDVIKKAWSTA